VHRSWAFGRRWFSAHVDGPLWAVDVQFDSTIDGNVIKIASMIDVHTRCRRCTW
jgi:hypothetical protein